MFSGLLELAARQGRHFFLGYLADNATLACIILFMTATFLICSLHSRFTNKGDQYKPAQALSGDATSKISLLSSIFPKNSGPAVQVDPPPLSTPSPSSAKKGMRYQNRLRRVRTRRHAKKESSGLGDLGTKQPYEAFLVLDIEGTCKLGTDFNYPNEIIEFPVCVLQWTDRSENGRANSLEVIDEFRTFVRPTWRPTLSDFCTELTGIMQEQVDSAPLFPEVLVNLEAFLVKNGLIEEGTRKRLKRFCWCSDGPFDIRDFVVKQCFISQVEMPPWVLGDVLDVRSAVLEWLHSQPAPLAEGGLLIEGLTRRTLNISAQLKVLGLPKFEGRQHSGIDDTRNIAKIVIELARRDVCLLPNTAINPGRRWRWMGKHGQVLEEFLT